MPLATVAHTRELFYVLHSKRVILVLIFRLGLEGAMKGM
jgi:hypothetical protein